MQVGITANAQKFDRERTALCQKQLSGSAAFFVTPPSTLAYG